MAASIRFEEASGGAGRRYDVAVSRLHGTPACSLRGRYLVEVRDDAGRVVHGQRLRRRAAAVSQAVELARRIRSGAGIAPRPRTRSR